MQDPVYPIRTTRKRTTQRKGARKTAASPGKPAPRDAAKKAALRKKAAAAAKDAWKIIKVGFHFGDSRTRVAASKNGENLRLRETEFTNIVGTVKLKVPRGLIPKKSRVLYGEQAMKVLRQVDLRRPISMGLITDVKICRQFMNHVCSAIDAAGSERLWGVVSIPASAGPNEAQKVQRSLSTVLERMAIVPEPYLAAEGMQLEKSIRLERFGEDLTRHSLVIDAGGATTDLCLVRGPFPGPADCVRLERAGDDIDERIYKNALLYAPTLFLNHRMAREIKEEQAFVGSQQEGSLQSGSDLIAFTEVIRAACESLLEAVVDAACELLRRCDPAGVKLIARNIILTGGGSRIRHFRSSLEERMRKGGFPEARVLVPEDYQGLVARGALRFAEKLSDQDWMALAELPSAQSLVGQFAEDGEPASVSWMDVSLRSEATRPSESAAAANQAAVPPEPTPAQAPSDAPIITHKSKEKTDTLSLQDLENELDLFKAR
jgi:rod shape-determining protein MreB